MHFRRPFSSFDEQLQKALRLSAPSGLKSGIGSVQLTPLSWQNIGGLHEVKLKLQSAVSRLLGLDRSRKYDESKLLYNTGVAWFSTAQGCLKINFVIKTFK